MAHVEKFQAGALGRVCDHFERRAELDHGYERENIDNSRSWLNYNLAPQRPVSQVEFINERIDSLNLKRRPRKDAVRMCDCVITMPRSFDPSRQREFFNAAYAFLAQRYGAENVVSAWVHRDETQPHMHFAWVPVTQDGRLSAKNVVNRLELKTLHPDMQVAMETALGCKVEIILDPEKAGEKQLSALNQSEYVAAKTELARIEEQITAANERLEGVQRREQAARDRSAELVREAYASVDECKGLEQQIVQLKAEVAESERHADGLAGAVKAEAGRVDELGDCVTAARERVGLLERAVEAARAKIRDFLEAVKRVPSAFAVVLGGEQAGVGAFWRSQAAEKPVGVPARAVSAKRAAEEPEKGFLDSLMEDKAVEEELVNETRVPSTRGLFDALARKAEAAARRSADGAGHEVNERSRSTWQR
jgi:hypothetical protein